MSKVAIPGRILRKGADGKRIAGRKIVSHGTFRCKRKPHSPRCRNMS